MTLSRPALILSLAAMLLGRVASAADAASESERPPTLAVEGTCPDGDAIWTDVKTIVPVGDLARVTNAKIDVTDLGETYRVRIVWTDGERLRVFRDLDRDCDHRARFAAVFIVLTLLPPDVLLDIRHDISPPPPPPVTPQPAATETPQSSPAPPPRRHLRLDLSGMAEAAPPFSGGPSATAFGAEIRSSWGSRAVAAMLGGGLEPHIGLRVGGLGVEEFRAPFDIGGSLVKALDRATLTGDLGLAGVLFRVSGTDTIQPQSGTRLDLGARAAIALRIGRPSATWAPVVGLHALWLPKPYELTAVPQGEIGKLSALWIGATAGLSFAR
jgi:hypothetical protein